MPDTNPVDLVASRIIEAGLALEPVTEFLEADIANLKPGVRSQGEAFVANAPSLYGYERNQERIALTLDVAISAIKADPTYGGGYALVAMCVYRLGVQDADIFDTRALAAAIPWAYRAITVDPECQDGWEIYVQLHCYNADFGTAEKALGEILKRFGDGDLYARCAFLYFRLKGDTQQAVNWGALAWQTEWDTHRLIHTLFSLGQLYRDVDLWAKALDAYRVITERDNENAWAYHYASQCAAQLGEYQYALELNGNAVAFGKIHEFRAYREELKKKAGTARMARGKISSAPRQKPVVVPAPKPSSTVVSAPPPSTNVIAAPPAATKVVKAPPPVTKKVVPAPRKATTKVVPAPPVRRPG
jgi:tetratricopeptide (TPR) repeat protein